MVVRPPAKFPGDAENCRTLPAVGNGFVIRRGQFVAGRLIRRAHGQDVLEADHLHRFLKHRAPAGVHQPVEERAYDGVARQPASAVRTAAFATDGQIRQGHWHALDAGNLFTQTCQAFFAARDAFARTARFLDEKPIRRAARIFYDVRNFFRLRIFTTQSHREHCAHVRMPRERKQQADGAVLVIVASRETDDMRIRLALRDGMGDMLRAFDGVDDEQEIAHAFAPVGAQVTFPLW